MSGKRYTEEFKIAAVKQVSQRGHTASELAERLEVSIHSLYARKHAPSARRQRLLRRSSSSHCRAAGSRSFVLVFPPRAEIFCRISSAAASAKALSLHNTSCLSFSFSRFSTRNSAVPATPSLSGAQKAAC